MASVPIEHRVARAGALHDLDPFGEEEPDGARIWVCDVSRPALVLGSRQVPETADRAACAAVGIEVVRRRSGGGAVLLRPGAQIWLDVVIPVEVVAPRGPVPDDVRGSMVWIGECWHEALIDLGADPDRVVTHRGAMVHTPWSDLVCFAGVGPGELLVGDGHGARVVGEGPGERIVGNGPGERIVGNGPKLLGLSQRRTRDGLRVQCQVYREPVTAELPWLLAVATPEVELAEPAILGDVVPPGTGDDTTTTTTTDGMVADAVAAAVGRRLTAE